MMEPTPLRPESEAAGGFIPVSVGGQTRHLPELKRHRNREWKERFQQTVTDTLDKSRALDDLEDVVQLIAGSSDVQLDLLVAYDESGALGGREWLDTHATDREIYAALKKVVAVAFPEMPDLLTRMPQLIGLVVEAAMRRSRSTSSSRPSTGGRQRRSKRT